MEVKGCKLEAPSALDLEADSLLQVDWSSFDLTASAGLVVALC